MKLKGINLTVVSIHRKGIFDMDAMIFCCDNCGRAIVNSAIVKDNESKSYVIGLDCKKTLIDKPLIQKIESTHSEWEAKYKIKDFKRESTDITNVMKYLDNPNKYEVRAETISNPFLIVYDNTQLDTFGNLGKTIYSESLGYLFKIGLKDVLQAAVNKGIIKPI
jgi:hypothetical protein